VYIFKILSLFLDPERQAIVGYVLSSPGVTVYKHLKVVKGYQITLSMTLTL
jgi:hypothetical protein